MDNETTVEILPRGRFCLLACFASRALEREIFITGVFLAFLRFESKKFRKFPFDRIR